MRIKILGIGVDNLNREQVLAQVLAWIEEGEKKCHRVITPNPEVIMAARKDKELAEIMESADLVIPDGVGVVWASKYFGERLPQTVPGCDLCYSIFGRSKEIKIRVYLLGAKPGVAEQARENMVRDYPALDICGVHDGYFKDEEDEDILHEINRLSPDLLLVGFGVPRQEKWIYKHRDNLRVGVAIGIGGSIDIMAGTVKRAPMIFRKLGLEWFYRLISQPSRILRMLELPKFVVAVMGDRRNKQ